VAAPLEDDAAMLLVHAPATWPAARIAMEPAGAARIASAS
jgi:hypothetical protein